MININKPGHFFEFKSEESERNSQSGTVLQPDSSRHYRSAMEAGVLSFLGEDLPAATFYLLYLEGKLPKRIEHGTPEYERFIKTLRKIAQNK